MKRPNLEGLPLGQQLVEERAVYRNHKNNLQMKYFPGKSWNAEGLEFDEEFTDVDMDLRRGLAWLDGDEDELRREHGRERLEFEGLDVYQEEVNGTETKVIHAKYDDVETPLKIDSVAIIRDSNYETKHLGTYMSRVGDREDGLVLDKELEMKEKANWHVIRGNYDDDVDNGIFYPYGYGEDMRLEEKLKEEAVSAWERSTDSEGEMDYDEYYHRLIQNSHTIPPKNKILYRRRKPEADVPEIPAEDADAWAALGVAMTDKDIDDFDSISLTEEDAEDNPDIDLEYVQGRRSVTHEDLPEVMAAMFKHATSPEAPPAGWILPKDEERTTTNPDLPENPGDLYKKRDAPHR